MNIDSVYVPATLNDSSKVGISGLGRRKKRKNSMEPITYLQLRAEMQKHLEPDGAVRPKQVYSNLSSALNQFLAGLAIPQDAVVGVELRTSYYKLTARHLEEMRVGGRSEQSVRDRKSLLKRWRTVFLTLDRAQAVEEHRQNPFLSALTEALPAGISLKTLSEQAEVPYSAIVRWRKGVIPSARSLPTLRRLERFLALPDGQLVDFLGAYISGKPDAQATNTPIAYRDGLSRSKLSPYRLRDVTGRLRTQWGEFLQYKSALLTFGLKRAEHGRWSPSPLHPGQDQVKKTWFAFTEQGEHVPTAGINWEHTVSYLGWLKTYGGHAEDAETIAWFANASVLGKYLTWYLQRSNNKANGGHVGFVSFALSLVHPNTGYLTQNHELRLSLPGTVSEQEWGEMCQSAFTSLAEHKKALKRTAEKSRDPNEPIAHTLALENPILALKDMRNRMRAARPTAGTYTEAVWGRDVALLGLLMCSPLRAKNLRHLIYRPDNTGHLRLRSDGAWELLIPKNEFKNRDGAAKQRDYCIELDPGIYRDLESYLKIYRSMLLNGNSSVTDLLFVSKKRGANNLPWKSINRRIETLTKKYLMRCPGVGPHAIRHIVATSIVKKSGEFSTAALVLHDNEETVRKNYAHLLSEDGHARYRQMFPNMFS